MWRLGFFFRDMAFGLLSVFLPLHVIAIGGSLVDIGIMFAIASFLAIPSSLFWGYLCDKTGRYKRYILLSFLASAVFLYFFTLTISVGFLIVLYAIMATLYVAYEPPKNVLISELYTHEEWKKTFAFYEAFTGTGWLIGLLLGFLMATYGFLKFRQGSIDDGLSYYKRAYNLATAPSLKTMLSQKMNLEAARYYILKNKMREAKAALFDVLKKQGGSDLFREEAQLELSQL